MSVKTESVKRRRKSKRYKPYSMTNPGDTDLEGFVATGRTGRRNALPDILDETVTKTSTSSLPSDLDKLSFDCDEKDEKTKSPVAPEKAEGEGESSPGSTDKEREKVS